MAAGINGVPGGIGDGELAGVLMPLPAPTKSVKAAGSRMSG